MLSQPQRTQLLSIARESIATVLGGNRLQLDLHAFDDDLKRPAGAFVSLHASKGGDLRGCIGSIHPVAPLVQSVSSNAVNAATRDPRFYPVRSDELASLHIEISVMSPIEPLTNVDHIVIGRDGLIISRGSRAGLLLPQVATEYGWDAETFLRHTCMKAGLPHDAWRSPECRIERFSAEVFGE